MTRAQRTNAGKRLTLLLISGEFPPVVGGIASAAAALYEGLNRIGINITVLAASTDNDKRLPPRLVRVSQLLLSTVWYCAKHKPDQTIAMTWGQDGIPAYVAKKLFGVPYVVFVHGTEIGAHRDKVLWMWVARRVLRSANAVLANSYYTRKLLHEVLPEHPVTVLHPPYLENKAAVQTDNEIGSVLDTYGIRGKRVLLTTGHLVPRKGHAQVIRALVHLKNRFPDVVFVATGDEPLRRTLAGLADNIGVGELVRFVGYVPRSRLHQLFEVAEIYVSPSTEVQGDVEGFGLAFIEAALHSLPVVAGRAGGTSDSVLDGVTGKLVDGTSIDQLVEALRSFLENPALGRTMGRAGRQHAEEHFSPEGQARTLMTLLGGAGSSSSPPPIDKGYMRGCDRA